MKLRFLLSAVMAAGTGILIASVMLVLQNDPQGEENSDCMHAEKFLTSGPDGMSASGHITVCSTPAASIVTYVYLHPLGALPTSKDLVFRYSQRATVDPPKIHWIDGQHLTVEATHVETVSKKERRLAHVLIEYKIATEGARVAP
jgi:hypothetical protein